MTSFIFPAAVVAGTLVDAVIVAFIVADVVGAKGTELDADAAAIDEDVPDV